MSTTGKVFLGLGIAGIFVMEAVGLYIQVKLANSLQGLSDKGNQVAGDIGAITGGIGSFFKGG